MYRLFEKNIRGGVTFCNKHIVTAENMYVCDGLLPNPNRLSIMYIDENNFYGAALRMKLPVSDLQFIDPADATIDWATCDTEGDIGFYWTLISSIPRLYMTKLNIFHS